MMVDEPEGVGVVAVPLDLIQRLTVLCGLGGMDEGGCMVGGRVPHWTVVYGKYTKRGATTLTRITELGTTLMQAWKGLRRPSSPPGAVI